MKKQYFNRFVLIGVLLIFCISITTYISAQINDYRKTTQELRDIDREATAIPNVRYFDIELHTYQIGQNDGKLGALPDRSAYQVDNSGSITNADPFLNFWDTILKKFFKSTLLGIVDEIPDKQQNYKTSTEITTLDTTLAAIPNTYYWDTTLERYCKGTNTNSLECWDPCLADCSGKECGSDGCGGTCGVCMGTCDLGVCTVPLPNSQLLAYYPFTGNTNDISGNAFHATLLGATLTPDQKGTANNAYNFDGSNDRIQTPITETQLTANNGQDFSMALWINPNRYSTSYNMVIASNRTSIGDTAYGFLFSLTGTASPLGTGKLSLTIGGGCNNDSVYTIEALPNNTWVHIAFSLDYDESTSNSIINIYKNGVQMTPTNINSARACVNTSYANTNIILQSSARMSSPANLYLGNDPNAPSAYYFDGQMDEVAIYDRALSSEEVADIYNYLIAN